MLTYKDLLLTGPEAVCILDAELEIKRHNRLLSLLLGYRGENLTGRHLSSILHDDTLIQRLLSSDSGSGWFQGECTLRMSAALPLVVKFRAGQIARETLSSASHEITDIIYHQSGSRFLPHPLDLSGKAREKVAQTEYALVFREKEQTLHLNYERRISALQFLLNVISERGMELGSALHNFARMFDRYAEAMMLPPDFGEGNVETGERHFSLPPYAVKAALEAVQQETAVFYQGETSWCFFPVRSQRKVYGIACIKFAVPRFYGEEDKKIFDMAGRALGVYSETYTSGGQAASAHPLLAVVLDDTNHPVVVVDRNGAITLCNAAARRVYGYTESEMMSKSFGRLVFPADSFVQYRDLLDHIMQGDPIHYEEMSHVRSDFTMIDVSLTAYPYKLDTGSPIGGIFIMRDLRKKRRLWQKIMEWEKLSALGEIFSSVANELNNPLTSLTGYSQLLLNRDNDEETNNAVSIIHEEAVRCGDIVHGILDLAWEDRGQKEYAHVNDIVISALNLKRRQLLPNNIAVRMDLAENIPGTVADPHDIERLFLRIISYAETRMVEYDSGGRLTVESAFENGRVVVRFTDTGACVLRDAIAEISDPFFTVGADESVGLGLSISCQILREIGGSIHIDSEIGKGNVFTIELPVIKEDSRDVVKHEKETPAFTLEIGRKILVVDDEPIIADLFVNILQQMGHEADVAGDGKEAMNKLESQTYDLIIADLRMPLGFTGEKLHKFIELKDPELAQKMIFVTGDAINPETRSFLQSTGNLYLEKPFLPESLQKAIETVLSR